MKLLHRAMAPATAACLLASAAAAQAPAAANAPAAGDKAVEIEFEFSVGMMGKAFGGVSTVRLSGDRYLVDSRFYKLGLAKALTASFTGSNRAWGSLATSKAAPQVGWSWIEYKGATRTWQVDYASDPFRETHQPPFTPKPDKAVTPDQKRGAFDPLNAGIVAILANGSRCPQTLPVFDSKRRFDVVIAPLTQGRLKPGEIPGADGEARICSVITTPIAGYDEEHMKKEREEAAEPAKATRVWIADFAPLGRPFPVKLELPTGFGTVTGRVTKVSERPLTADERAQLGR